MQVRYQAAPRPDRMRMIAEIWIERFAAPLAAPDRDALTAQDLDQFLELEAHLMDELLALIEIHLGIITREAIARTADGEALLVEKAADLANDEHVLALVIAAIATALDGLELRELLLPVAQHMWLDPAKVAHFTNGEVPLARDRGQLAVIAWFQHTPRRAPSVSGQAGTSRRAAR